MALLTRTDLQYEYSWVAIGDDDPRKTGKPDSVLLNRHEGYEVLPFINGFCARTQWDKPATKATALKVERMIRKALPTNLHSRAHIETWLLENFNDSAV